MHPGAGQPIRDWPSGLRTGSPPSPPPHLLRRTDGISCGPRAYRVRVPIKQLIPTTASALGCYRLRFGELLEFRENIAVMLRQVSHDACIPQQLTEVSVGENKVEMINAV